MEHPKPRAVLMAGICSPHGAPERMTEPGACGSWSVKDVLAHLAVENGWLALQLERGTRGKVPGPEEVQHNRELGLADNQQLKDWTWPMCGTGIAGPTSACSPP